MPKPRISVIVLNWNGKDHLNTCLTSLVQQSYDNYEVILVDNGSIDGSLHLVQSLFPGVKTVALSENLGFSGGNNRGVEAAQADLVAFLNNDAEADRHWLAALVEAATRMPHVGCFASKMLLFDDRSTIDDAGDEFHTAGFASKRGHLQPDGQEYNQECEVFGPCAGAALYRKAVLDEIGLFDTDFFANGEDIDLSFRARLRGYPSFYIPNAVVYHKGGASIGNTTRWFYLMRRNQVWVLLKNMPWQLLFKFAPDILSYNLLSLIYHTAKGRGKLIWKAYWDAFSGLPRVLSQRKRIQAQRTASLRDLENALIRKSLWSRALKPVTGNRRVIQSYRLD